MKTIKKLGLTRETVRTLKVRAGIQTGGFVMVKTIAACPTVSVAVNDSHDGFCAPGDVGLGDTIGQSLQGAVSRTGSPLSAGSIGPVPGGG